MASPPGAPPPSARVDGQVSALLESFVSLVKSCRLSESALLSDIEGLHTQVCASKVVQTASALMDSVDKLERSAIVGDFEAANDDCDAHNAALRAASAAVHAEVNAAGVEMRDLLARCEDHYEASVARARKHEGRGAAEVAAAHAKRAAESESRSRDDANKRARTDAVE